MLRGIELSEKEIEELDKKEELPQELKPIIELFNIIEQSRIIMYNGNLYLML